MASPGRWLGGAWVKLRRRTAPAKFHARRALTSGPVFASPAPRPLGGWGGGLDGGGFTGFSSPGTDCNQDLEPCLLRATRCLPCPPPPALALSRSGSRSRWFGCWSSALGASGALRRRCVHLASVCGQPPGRRGVGVQPWGGGGGGDEPGVGAGGGGGRVGRSGGTSLRWRRGWGWGSWWRRGAGGARSPAARAERFAARAGCWFRSWSSPRPSWCTSRWPGWRRGWRRCWGAGARGACFRERPRVVWRRWSVRGCSWCGRRRCWCFPSSRWRMLVGIAER